MAATLPRLCARLRPFWGTGPGGVRFTALAADTEKLATSLPGVLAGRPGKHVTEENGYLSRNAGRVALLASCGLTVDGELIAPEPGRVVSITADKTVRFVRG